MAAGDDSVVLSSEIPPPPYVVPTKDYIFSTEGGYKMKAPKEDIVNRSILLKDVPRFRKIRWHAGEAAVHSLGCLIVGTEFVKKQTRDGVPVHGFTISDSLLTQQRIGQMICCVANQRGISLDSVKIQITYMEEDDHEMRFTEFK